MAIHARLSMMSRPFVLLITSGAILLAGLLWLTFAVPRAQRGAATVQGTSPLPPIREIRDFSLTNQAGLALTRADLLGKPWAVNLIFTRCPGPCTQLSGVMRTVQNRLPKGSSARLLSLTSDPEFDTPSVLARYAEKMGAEVAGWQFATGTRSAIRRLATEDLMLVLQDKAESQRESPEDLFLHSTMIILVDAKGRVRNLVEGLEPGAADLVVRLLGELEREQP